MKVLFRQPDGSWAEPEITTHKSEDDLQQILATSADLLPGDETGLPMAVAREVRIGSGQIDVVGVNVEGEITLCECKLATNPGARREVLGQILEYAGALGGMSYDDFSDRFRARGGESLAEAVSEVAGEDFESDLFLAQVSENLKTGRFRLVVVVDKITESLRHTVSYLNEHLDGSILALELAYLRNGEVEILIPAVYGEESVERKVHQRKSPVVDADTVVVAARIAYKTYLDTDAYVCQGGRRFRDGIKYMGFYKDKAIQPEFPTICHRRDQVPFTHENAAALRASGDQTDLAIAGVIESLLDSTDQAVGADAHQVFLLTSRDDPETLLLPHAVRNTKPGAFTQGQRYTSSAALRRHPSTTDELEAEGG